MTRKNVSLWFGRMVIMLWALAPGVRGANIWQGPAGGNWFEDGNWSEGQPGDGDDVVIDNGASVLLTNSTAELNSFTLSNATLVVANWASTIRADTVTIGYGGTNTLPAPFAETAMSNRIHILCGDLRVASNGALSADAKGYIAGPVNGSWGDGAGGGHGGLGGMSTSWTPGGAACGDPVIPVRPGNAGGSGRTAPQDIGGGGGGVILVEATGEIRVDGAISANGGNGGSSHPYTSSGGGAGGSILLIAQTFAGTGGMVRANGGDGGSYTGYGLLGGGGAGGRVALHFDTSRQNAFPGIDVSARAGATPIPPQGWYFWQQADAGSIYVTDAHKFFDLDATPFSGMAGYLRAPGLAQLDFDGLDVAPNCLLGFDQNMTLVVTNGVTVPATSGILARGALTLNCGGSFTNAGMVQCSSTGVWNVGGDLILAGSNSETRLKAPTVAVGGDLIITSATLRVFGAAVADPAVDTGGAVNVSGDLTLKNSGWIRAYAEPYNGGVALFTCDNLAIDADSGIDANEKGYAPVGSGKKGGPGGPTVLGGWTDGAGAGHGGPGGMSSALRPGGVVYDERTIPVQAGSAGETGLSVETYPGGAGGGAIRVDAGGEIRVDGTISADGGNGGGSHPNTSAGGGSGGSILLIAQTFAGDGGIVRANGGNGTLDGGTTLLGGGGAGGRIAIWYGMDRAKRQPLFDNLKNPKVQKRIVETATVPGFDGLVPTVAGGAGYEAGGNGTVAFLKFAAGSGLLIILK